MHILIFKIFIIYKYLLFIGATHGCIFSQEILIFPRSPDYQDDKNALKFENFTQNHPKIGKKISQKRYFPPKIPHPSF